MPNLFEDALAIISLGVAAEIILAILLVWSGRGVLLWVMGGVLAITLGLLGLERLVVTERETLAATIDEGRTAVEANNLEASLRFVAPQAQEVRAAVRDYLWRFTFRDVKISGLEIVIDHDAKPLTAKVKAVVQAGFRDRKGELTLDRYVTSVNLEFEKQGDRWVVRKLVEATGFRP